VFLEKVVFAPQKPPFQLHYFVFMVSLTVNLKFFVMFGFKALQELAGDSYDRYLKLLKEKKKKLHQKKDVDKKDHQYTTADIIETAQAMNVNLF
jgi:hypothetical protein